MTIKLVKLIGEESEYYNERVNKAFRNSCTFRSNYIIFRDSFHSIKMLAMLALKYVNAISQH